MVHTLSLLEGSPYGRTGYYSCNLCWERGSGPVYHCSDCDFDLHVACAAIDKQQTHFSHFRHPLQLCRCSRGHKCDSCGQPIGTWAFRCEICDFDIHSLCVRAPRFIVHPSHKHPLSLMSPPSSDLQQLKFCNGCSKSLSDLFYRCHTCDYAIHQFCATLPFKLRHPAHPQHILSLLLNNTHPYICGDCGEQGKGWRFNCASCGFDAHPGCAKIVHELPHDPTDSPCSAAKHASTSNGTVNFVTHHDNTGNVIASGCKLDHNDIAALERVLTFARGVLKTPSLYPSDADTRKEPEVCPTCLEGYDPRNPKKSTTCGHHFHLACILQWMERSTSCPICRKNINILM